MYVRYPEQRYKKYQYIYKPIFFKKSSINLLVALSKFYPISSLLLFQILGRLFAYVSIFICMSNSLNNILFNSEEQ